MNESRTLTIRFGDTDADYLEFESAWQAAERGETLPLETHVLTFESLAGFLTCLTKSLSE